MTMKIIVVNDDPNRTLEIDTIETSKGPDDQLLAAVTKQEEVEPGRHKEFYIWQEKWITVKEK
jgi:hypothetical protein